MRRVTDVVGGGRPGAARGCDRPLSRAGRRSCFAAGILLLAVLPMARAQGPRGQLQTLDRETGVGTVDSFEQGRMVLKLKGNELWEVVPAPTAKIEVNGTASREMLQAGTFIVCAVEFDEMGRVAAPPVRVTFPGTGTPGITAGGLGIVAPGTKRLPGKRPPGQYIVSGPIKSTTDDGISVQVGREKVDIPVPETTELLVNTQDFSIVEAGDKVTVEGQYYRRGQLQATVLTITRVNPLTPPPAKTKGPKRPLKAS